MTLLLFIPCDSLKAAEARAVDADRQAILGNLVEPHGIEALGAPLTMWRNSEAGLRWNVRGSVLAGEHVTGDVLVSLPGNEESPVVGLDDASAEALLAFLRKFSK